MTEQEVLMLRLIEQAQALACGVAQEVKSRKVLVLSVSGEVRKFRKVEQARKWLREYMHCAMHGRRCFEQGCACRKGFNS